MAPCLTHDFFCDCIWPLSDFCVIMNEPIVKNYDGPKSMLDVGFPSFFTKEPFSGAKIPHANLGAVFLLDSSWLWQLFRLFQFLLTLTVLKSIPRYCAAYPPIRVCLTFGGLDWGYDIWGQRVKCHRSSALHITSRRGWCIVAMLILTLIAWPRSRWPGFSIVRDSFSLLPILDSW